MGIVAEALVYQNLNAQKLDLIDLMFYSNSKYDIIKRNFVKEILKTDDLCTILAIPVLRKNPEPFIEIGKKNISILDLKYHVKDYMNFTSKWYGDIIMEKSLIN